MMCRVMIPLEIWLLQKCASLLILIIFQWGECSWSTVCLWFSPWMPPRKCQPVEVFFKTVVRSDDALWTITVVSGRMVRWGGVGRGRQTWLPLCKRRPSNGEVCYVKYGKISSFHNSSTGGLCVLWFICVLRVLLHPVLWGFAVVVALEKSLRTVVWAFVFGFVS